MCQLLPLQSPRRSDQGIQTFCTNLLAIVCKIILIQDQAPELMKTYTNLKHASECFKSCRDGGYDLALIDMFELIVSYFN